MTKFIATGALTTNEGRHIDRTIYGVGETAEAAIADAHDFGAEGDVTVTACTDALYAEVIKNGGYVDWTVVDGIADVVVEQPKQVTKDSVILAAYCSPYEFTPDSVDQEIICSVDLSKLDQSHPAWLAQAHQSLLHEAHVALAARGIAVNHSHIRTAHVDADLIENWWRDPEAQRNLSVQHGLVKQYYVVPMFKRTVGESSYG